MKIKIFQAKSECAFKFMRYSFVEKFFNGNVDFERNYKKVYEFEEEYEGDINTLLEGIYIRFQGLKPSGYSGHSLSMSDIVVVDGIKYYVDDIGFKKLSAD